jgi:hypothetical protein
LKRAVALEPTNARFHEGLVQLYAMTQRPAEALVEGRRALQLDPLSPTANAEFAHALLVNDRCDEALPAELQANLWRLGVPCDAQTPRDEVVSLLWARKRNLSLAFQPTWDSPGATPPNAA